MRDSNYFVGDSQRDTILGACVYSHVCLSVSKLLVNSCSYMIMKLLSLVSNVSGIVPLNVVEIRPELT